MGVLELIADEQVHGVGYQNASLVCIRQGAQIQLLDGRLWQVLLIWLHIDQYLKQRYSFLQRASPCVEVADQFPAFWCKIL